jgi:hypothetical protein
MPIILATWEAEIGRVSSKQSVRSSQANSLQDPIFKITRARWIEVVTQEVESLLCKAESPELSGRALLSSMYEALGSIPTNTHTKIIF